MSPNTLVINCDLRETRVALIENGVIAELQIERAAHRGTVGNIVLGRVSRVLPGMQAAFIDVGMDRAAFLHVEDLIRPDDFEAYLAGDFGEIDKAESGKDVGAKLSDAVADDEPSGDQPLISAESSGAAAALAAASAEEDDDDDEDLLDGEGDEDDDEDDDEDEDDLDDSSDGDEDEDEEDDDDEDEDEDDGDEDEDEDDDDLDDSSGGDGGDDEDDDEDDGDEEEEEEEERSGRNKRRRRRRGGSNARGSERGERSRSRNRDASRSAEPTAAAGERKKSSRVSRSVPITDVVKEGDQVIVQISKEPIGTKGARVTSHVSLPGRYCVFLPTVDHIGISKRIGSTSERGRLRQVIEAMKPKTGGIIVRTVAQGLTKKSLKADLGYLMRLWSDVSKRVETAKAPALLYSELDLVLKTARDLFTDDIDKIVIDDKEQYARLVRFVEMFLPGRVKDIELYQGDEPIFDAYGIEDEIARALSRKVPLPSGGYLIIDQAEALTAIDVNTGRFVGKGSGSLEETALKTNLEAVEEIAYQLRFRNVGGLVVLDLIDMEDRSNREKVYRALDHALKKDKAKTTINRISELGLIEMTRKRTRESLSRTMHEPCFYCDGTGHIQSRTTIAYEILRQVRRERGSLTGYSIVVNAHPAVIDLLQGEERAAVKDAEARYMRRIKLVARKEYHIEQFDLKGE
ncbi:MAG TPA: Rne/Rng family ribonuclease [Polyangiaceae bacterium]|nr:Rne/Rng family ribonuclease [Polyangiaceae bacterium]